MAGSRTNREFIICAVCIVCAIAIGLMVGLLPGRNDTSSKEDPVETPIPTDTSTSSTITAPWPQDDSDIPLDPNVRVGELENGMRYMIMPHTNPPGKLSLRLRIDAGSLMEAEDQRGLAHFLEHMLFNGSRNYKPGELFPIMQRLGIGFGSHANAYTTFDETVYILDLPNTEDDVLDLGFTVMRDYADGALLLPEEIEKERGVVLSEKNTRDKISDRLLKQKLDTFLPDHLLASRFPIGTKEVISTAPRERFVDFYTRYYTPQRMTLVASGDMDADTLEAHIIETFESMINPEDPGPDPVLGTLPVGAGFRTAVFADEELTKDTLEIFTVLEAPRVQDTVETRITKKYLEVAEYLIHRRFRTRAFEQDSPIKSGKVSSYTVEDAVELSSFLVEPADGRWKEAVMVLEQEFRRALVHGFTQSELDETKAIDINSHEDLVEKASTRKVPDLAAKLSTSVNSHTVFSSPEENLRVVEKAYAEITIEKVNAAFREKWETQDLSLNLITKEAPEKADDVLAMLYKESQAVDVAPPVDYADIPFAYTDFGLAGSITSDVMVEDLDIRQLILSNNVRVNMKKTDFEENQISITARFGTGKVGLPKDQAELADFTHSVMSYGGLGKHSKDELTRIFAGKTVSLNFYLDNGGFDFVGTTTPDDLELQLQYIVAAMLDPGFREDGAYYFRQAVPDILAQMKYTINGAATHMDSWLKGGDGRFAAPTKEGFDSLTIDHVKDWMVPQLTESYLELSIVGDFDSEGIIPLLLKTVGAMPLRNDAPAVTGLSQLDGSYPESPSTKLFTYESKIPKAAAVIKWKTTPIVASNINEIRQLVVLGQILGDRLFTEIREELGAAYSPRAKTENEQFIDYGVMSASAITVPEDAVTVGERMIEIGQSLSQNGASEDEFLRAMEPHTVNLESSLRDNSYWLFTVMRECQAKPFKLDWSRGRDTAYATFTVDGVNQLAAKYLQPENAIFVEIQPVNEEGEDSGADPVVADEEVVVESRSSNLRGWDP